MEREAIAASLTEVRSRIRAACLRAGRDPSEVTLVAVTKTVPADVVRLAAGLGVADFGENYAKELAAKAPLVPATWHFVGRIQRGTAAAVAGHADVVHSAIPGQGIAAVASRAARAGKRMRFLVQVDYTGRRQGVDPDDVGAFIGQIHSTAGAQVLGLMTLPPLADNPEAMRSYFARLRDLRDRLRKEWPEVSELSMGMSLDYEVAVEEGATMVRVGTALFGDRPVGAG